MKKQTIRAGIIGSGFAARFHYEALYRVYGVNIEITGVFSPNETNCRSFAEERDIPVRKSASDLMEHCDVVHICTPPATHEPLAVEALEKNRSVIVEKPFTGYYGDGTDEFDGDTFDRATGLKEAAGSIQRILEAEKKSTGTVCYAENWVYAPAVQKEREIIEKTGARILWIHGEESHNGSHSPYYGIWSHSGGGSLIGKGVHPLTAALYLKAVEGRSGRGTPIRPQTVSARTHKLTRDENFEDKGFIRTGYRDIEDFGSMHITFDDGTIADIFASEIVMGGVHNHLEINASTHRTRININPNTAMETFNPEEKQFDDIYVVEKISTKQGWSPTSPDEDWFTGYYHEMEGFYGNVLHGTRPESDSQLASDTIMTVYAAYVSAAESGKETVIELI